MNSNNTLECPILGTHQYTSHMIILEDGIKRPGPLTCVCGTMAYIESVDITNERLASAARWKSMDAKWNRDVNNAWHRGCVIGMLFGASISVAALLFVLYVSR